MELLLTILSVLALWALLTLLVVGLLLIFKAIESVRSHMRKITMGVRAIERETAPLAPQTTALAAALNETGEALSTAAARLAAVEKTL